MPSDKNTVINDFIKNFVDLNKSRIDRMEKGLEVVTALLKDNEPFKNLFIGVAKQGSFRHGTATRPVTEDDDFDLDLLFEIKPIPNSEPKDYLKVLHDFFHERDRYKDIVDRRGKTRCVTLDYESDFHIDIVPCVEIGGKKMIANKNDNIFEPTDGDGYAEWFAAKNAITKGNLAKAVQMMKYIRDHKGTFTIKSVVLTTLLASQVSEFDNPECYSSVTASLKTLLARLDLYLQARSSIPDVNNPALLTEKFTQRNWAEENYKNFRTKFHDYSSRIIQAIDASDEDFSREMKDILGYDFIIEKCAIVFNRTHMSDGFPSEKEQFIEDMVVGVAPTAYTINIDATIKADGWDGRKLSQVGTCLPTEGQLDFFITGIPTHVDRSKHQLYWKVKNRGMQAQQLGELRGEITPDQGQHRKIENTRYIGSHYIECYLVNGETHHLVGRGMRNVTI